MKCTAKQTSEDRETAWRPDSMSSMILERALPETKTASAGVPQADRSGNWQVVVNTSHMWR